MRGDKNDRRENPFSGQTPLQLEPSHPWHAHVQNQASREAQLRGIQKVLRRKKSCGGVADGLQQTDCSLDDRAVVVHNRNQGNFGRAQFFARQESDLLNLTSVDPSTLGEMHSTIPWYGIRRLA